MKRLVLSLIICVLFISCGGTTQELVKSLSEPTDIVILENTFTNIDIVGVVSNKGNGTISILDLSDKKVLDIDDNVDKTQSIFVGGSASSLHAIVDPQGTHEAIIIVSTLLGNQSYLVFVGLSIDADKNVTYEFIDVGTDYKTAYLRPVFYNKGSSSNPRMTSVSLNVDLIGNTLWYFEYKKGQYNVKTYAAGATVATELTTAAEEGVTFTSDDSELSLTIEAGTRDASKGDYFYFYTVKYKPYLYSGLLTDITVDGTDIYVASYENDAGKLAIFSYDGTLTEITSTTFSGYPEKLEIRTYNDVKYLFIANSDGIDNDADGVVDENSSYYIDVTDYQNTGLTLNKFNLGFNASNIDLDDTSGYLYATPEDDYKVYVYNFETGETIRQINTLDLPIILVPSDLVYSSESEILNDIASTDRKLVFFGGLFGDLYALDTNNISDISVSPFIDTSVRTGINSSTSITKFIDYGVTSEPSMTAIETVDTKTLDESFLIIYEGDLPSTESETGAISGTTLTDANATFSSINIALKENSDDTEYDVIYISAGDYSGTELPITEVTDDNNLSFELPEGTEITDGTTVSYVLRAEASYIVIGSVSGLMLNRAKEDVIYTSDEEEIKFLIKASNINPTTMGDFFLIDTYSGVEPIETGANPTAISFFREDSEYYAVVLGAGSDEVWIVDVNEMSRKYLIR